MPASDVKVPLPLTRLPPLYPGQFGVPNTGADTGLRHSCEGTVFYVDPNHSDANDSRDGTEPDAPLATVAAAIGKCEAYKGDVILVMANNAGPYNDPTEGRATSVNEAVVVDVPGISIIGVSPSPMGVYWYVPADSVGITINVTDVVIEGFAFFGNDGDETAIKASYGTEFGDNVTVRHCYFGEDLGYGIDLDYAWYADIHDCMFDEVDYGIYNAAADEDAAYARIYRNWFYDCPDGAIWLPDADRCFISLNEIYNNDAANDAAAANVMINLGNGSRNLVSRNLLGCKDGAGNGHYDDVCSSGTDDVWACNYLWDAISTDNPA
jgi:hypothetical protein